MCNKSIIDLAWTVKPVTHGKFDRRHRRMKSSISDMPSAIYTPVAAIGENRHRFSGHT